MKIRIVLLTLFCIIFGAAAVSAQEKPASFAGHWELDVSKSNMSDRMRFESMTMVVTQTDAELKVETKGKRAERPEGENRGGGMRRSGGVGRGGMMGGGDSTFTYTLDGKETASVGAPEMGSANLKAEFQSGGKLKLTQTRMIETQMGTRDLKIVDTWELKDEGKTLKVKREMETPRGTQTSEFHFTKH